MLPQIMQMNSNGTAFVPFHNHVKVLIDFAISCLTQ